MHLKTYFHAICVILPLSLATPLPLRNADETVVVMGYTSTSTSSWGGWSSKMVHYTAAGIYGATGCNDSSSVSCYQDADPVTVPLSDSDDCTSVYIA